MNRQMWIFAGLLAAIAVVTGYIVKTKTDTVASNATDQSQLPADNAEANYTVPPDIGASVNATGGINFPTGSNVTYTVGQGNSLPITPVSSTSG